MLSKDSYSLLQKRKIILVRIKSDRGYLYREKTHDRHPNRQKARVLVVAIGEPEKAF